MNCTVLIPAFILVISAISATAVPLRSSRKHIRASVQSSSRTKLISSAASACSRTTQQPGQEKYTEGAIVVLQRQLNSIKKYGGRINHFVASTESSFSMADQLTASELEAWFPELLKSPKALREQECKDYVGHEARSYRIIWTAFLAASNPPTFPPAQNLQHKFIWLEAGKASPSKSRSRLLEK